MKPKVLNEFNKLENDIATTLVPAILELMDCLGYEDSFKYCDERNGEHSIHRTHLIELIENPTKFFTPYTSTDRPYSIIDDRHRNVLSNFSDLKTAFIALVKRKTEAAQASMWIDTISIAYERKIIIEKTKNTL